MTRGAWIAIVSSVLGALIAVFGAAYLNQDLAWHASTDARIGRLEQEVSVLSQRLDDHDRDDAAVEQRVRELERRHR